MSFCKAETRISKKVKVYDYLDNHDGSSKVMELAAVLILTITTHDEKIVIVETIVADDDISMNTILRHSFEEKDN
eukprot:4940152-Ditylum_brightwellii.AAC.1